MKLFDSHCHFDFAPFEDDRESLWSQCTEFGICHLLIPGIEPAQWQSASYLSERFQGVLTAAGLHPWWLEKAQLPAPDDWYKALSAPLCVAVGECGLDAAIETPMAKQEAVFSRHLEMAIDSDLPLIIHVRQTHNETLRCLKRYCPPAGGVIHGFTGSREMAMEYWKLGFYLGVGGSITYPRANKTRMAIQSMPLEALLLETDAPDMPLYGFQGQPNSPLQLLRVAQSLAELVQQPVEEVADQTTQNSYRLFDL